MTGTEFLVRHLLRHVVQVANVTAAPAGLRHAQLARSVTAEAHGLVGGAAGADTWSGVVLSGFTAAHVEVALVAVAASAVSVAVVGKVGPILYRYIWSFFGSGGDEAASEPASSLPSDTLAAYQVVAARESFRPDYVEPDPDRNPFHGGYF